MELSPLEASVASSVPPSFVVRSYRSIDEPFPEDSETRSELASTPTEEAAVTEPWWHSEQTVASPGQRPPLEPAWWIPRLPWVLTGSYANSQWPLGPILRPLDDEGGQPKGNPVPPDKPRDECCCCVERVAIKKGTASAGKSAAHNPFTVEITLSHKGPPGKTCPCTLKWMEFSRTPYVGNKGKEWIDMGEVHGKKTYAQVEGEANVQSGSLTPEGRKGSDIIRFLTSAKWNERYSERAARKDFECWPKPQTVSVADTPGGGAERELFIQVCVCSCKSGCDCTNKHVCVRLHQVIRKDAAGRFVGTLNAEYLDKNGKQVSEIEAKPPGGWPPGEKVCG